MSSKHLVDRSLVVKDKFDGNLVLPRATKRIHRLFGEDMQVEFQILEKMSRDSSGKLRTAISQVPVHLSGRVNS